MLLRDTIYRKIRDAILANEFRPGQELREQALAERYRVSRSPVRDSLLRLERENLVTVLPRQGYRINPITMSEVADVLGFRLLLEPICTAAAAQATENPRAELDRLRSFGRLDDVSPESIELDKAFHRVVVSLSGNRRLAAIARDLTEQFGRLMQIALPFADQEAIRRDWAEHDAILDALLAHEAERASRLSYEHTKAAHACVTAALRRQAAAE